MSPAQTRRWWCGLSARATRGIWSLFLCDERFLHFAAGPQLVAARSAALPRRLIPNDGRCARVDSDHRESRDPAVRTLRFQVWPDSKARPIRVLYPTDIELLAPWALFERRV